MGPLLDENARREHKTRNLKHSAMLLGGIGLMLVTAAWLVWGWPGVVAVLAMLLTLPLAASHLPPEAIMRLYRARLQPRDDSQISSLVDVLAYRAELPRRPDLYVVPSMTLNAFATGTPEKAAIAITEGLLRRLTLREIAGVLAHEMSHVRNNDLWILSLADILSRGLQVLSYLALVLAVLNLYAGVAGDSVVSWWAILLLYLAPAASSLLQLALSRTREFDADLEAAALTGDPLGVASALRSLEATTGHFWEDLQFPVPARRVPVPSLLRTHPTNEERIRRLVALSGRPRLEPIVLVEEPMMSLVGYGPIEMRPRYRWPGVWF